jgi:hypothetical protein
MPSGKPFFRGGKFGKPILISDRNQTVLTLKHLLAYAPFKTLGTYQAATHGQKKQFEVLQEKALSLCQTLALSHCSANAAWLFYSSILMKLIGYLLSVSRLTCSKLRTLQGPMVSITLNRMHYSKRTARVLVYGPRYYGGLELDTLQLVQGAGKIILLIRHLQTLGQPHELLLIVLDRIQYIAGLGFHILEDTKSSLPHLEGIWLPTARDYLGQISGSIKIAGLHIQPLERHGDKYLMEMAMVIPGLSPGHIKVINYCQLFLQVLTISNICNAEGTQLVAGTSQGNRNRDQSYSILEVPLQEQPNAVSWGIWRRFSRQFCYNLWGHGTLDCPQEDGGHVFIDGLRATNINVHRALKMPKRTTIYFNVSISFASNGEKISSTPHTTLTVTFLIQIYSPLSKLVFWRIFRIACPSLRKGSHVPPIQNHGSLQTSKL